MCLRLGEKTETNDSSTLMRAQLLLYGVLIQLCLLLLWLRYITWTEVQHLNLNLPFTIIIMKERVTFENIHHWVVLATFTTQIIGLYCEKHYFKCLFFLYTVRHALSSILWIMRFASMFCNKRVKKSMALFLKNMDTNSYFVISQGK